MKIIYKLACIGIFTLASCGGGGDGGEETIIPTPKATTLVFPSNNEACNEGTAINDTQSTVEFKWNASPDTDSYEINLKDLASGITSKKTVSATKENITIKRGTPYEWFVISKANGTTETAKSSTWKFYNQGVGVENYAPFPAEVISPARGATIASASSVSLKWSSSDVDNDIVGHEVFFGTETTPVTSIGTTTNTGIDATIASGSTYYWRVVTKDSQNNTSDSEVFQFKVE